MKTPLYIISLFLYQTTIGQIKFEGTIKDEFNHLLLKQAKEIRQKKQTQSFEDGFALVSTFKVDTLNNRDIKLIAPETLIQIMDIDEVTGKELHKKSKPVAKTNLWLSCQASYLNDTLQISSFFGLLGGYNFSVKIIGEKASGTFREYFIGNEVFKIKLTDPTSSDIEVQAQSSVNLSKKPINLGDTFYGKVTFITDPYYEQDNNYNNGFIYKRNVITYLFTCKLNHTLEH